MNTTYLRRQRHILLDMHVPDWDENFLTQFDPESFSDLCARSGADAVMVYCNSHVGLCYWPTQSGKMHPGLHGRDAVKVQVDRLHEHGLAVCAYYSGPMFNNWAYTECPQWRLMASSPGGMAGPGSRYGVLCPNRPGCMSFMLQQVGELVDEYAFDAFFFDMVFWTSVCVCESCRERYRAEEGAAIPDVLDWHSPDWCRFQAARERWLADAYRQLRERVKASLDVPVFLNGGIVKFDWWAGTGYELMEMNDLVGGDFEHQSVLPTLARFTPTVMQYMKAISAYGGGASRLMPLEEQKAHAFAATAFGGQFMAIDAVAPDGKVSPAVYDRLGEVFRAMEPYAPYLGGVPIADIGVYASQQAAVNFADNGTRLDEIGSRISLPPASPHSAAVEGAVDALKIAHVPFGVLTRRDLGRLDDFPVILLPNVLRMDAEEIEAFREYVRRGGRLYASGYASLVAADGVRHPDFLLADVFGCHAKGEETAAVTYIRPTTDDVARWIAPISYAAHGKPGVNTPGFGAPITALRVEADTAAEVLATTTLPYGDGRGSRDDREWASIHNSPPWQDTGRPAVIRHRYGAGEVVYSTVDLEGADEEGWAARELLVGLVRSLLSRNPTFEAETHPNVWMTGFRDSGSDEIRLCFLNFSAGVPALPIPIVRFRLAVPTGYTFTGLRRLPTGEALAFEQGSDGSISAEIHDLSCFDMLAASYAPEGEHADGHAARPAQAADGWATRQDGRTARLESGTPRRR